MSINPIPTDNDFDEIPISSSDAYKEAIYVDPEKKIAHLKVWVNSEIVQWLMSLPGRIDLNVNDILYAIMEKHKSGDSNQRQEIDNMLKFKQ